MKSNAFPATLELSCGPVSALDLALYAAASGDHNPLHLDAEVARDAGFEQAVVHGMLSMAHAARLFTAHFGVAGLLRLNTRFVGVALRGDSLCFRAELGECDGETAHYTLNGHNAAGLQLVTGSAQVRCSAP